MNSIKFTRTRNVKAPNRGTTEAAGIDFFIPFLDAEFVKDLVLKNPNADVLYKIEDNDLYITLLPNSRILIPSGVRTAFEKATALIAANKSGVSTKKGLVFTAQVVDSDYDGELHIGVANISSEPVTIKTGDKLIQFIHTPVYLTPLVEVSTEDVTTAHSDSVRGDKGFGEGTGNK